MYDWKETLLRPSNTLADAIKVLDGVALRIVLVTDEGGRLLGTVTDGDIRRALLRHKGMDALLSDIMFKEPTTASVNDDRKDILEMMRRKDLLQVPLMDAKGYVVGLETVSHLLHSQKIENPVFLVAGGFGKRLRPLTNEMPKPLLKVGSKPILETILIQFVEAGFHRFYISTHYKADMVREHFGDGGQWGINIEYIHEQEPRGTAGGLGLLPKGLPDIPIIMMNGDLLTKVNFLSLLDFHSEQGGVATMCVREYNFQVPYGVVKSDGHKIKSIAEKPVHNFFINAGIYVLDYTLVRNVEGSSYLDMPQLLENQIESGKQVNMFPLHEYWLDIGQVEEYERAQEDVSDHLL